MKSFVGLTIFGVVLSIGACHGAQRVRSVSEGLARGSPVDPRLPTASRIITASRTLAAITLPPSRDPPRLIPAHFTSLPLPRDLQEQTEARLIPAQFPALHPAHAFRAETVPPPRALRAAMVPDPITIASDAVAALSDLTGVLSCQGDYDCVLTNLVDDELIRRASGYIADCSSKFEDITGTKGFTALPLLESYGAMFRQWNRTVVHLVETLEKDVNKIHRLMNQVPGGPITQNERAALASSFGILSETLTTCSAISDGLVDQLRIIALNMVDLNAALSTLGDRFTQARDTQSEYMQGRIAGFHRASHLKCRYDDDYDGEVDVACLAARDTVLNSLFIPGIQDELDAASKMMSDFTAQFQAKGFTQTKGFRTLQALSGRLGKDTSTKVASLLDFQDEVHKVSVRVATTQKYSTIDVAKIKVYLGKLEELKQECTGALESFPRYPYESFPRYPYDFQRYPYERSFRSFP